MAAQMPVGTNRGRSGVLIILSIILVVSLVANGFFILRYRGVSKEAAKAVLQAKEAESRMKLIGEKLDDQSKAADVKLQGLAQENQSLKDRVQKVNEERGAVISGLEKRIAELSSKESKLSNQIKEGEDKFKRVDLLEADLLKAKGQAEHLSLQSDELKAGLSAQSEINKNLSSEKGALANEIEEIKNKLQGALSENDLLMKEIYNLKDELQKAINEKEALRAQYTSLNEEIRKEISKQAETKGKLEEYLKAKEEEIKRLKQTYDSLTKNLKEEIDRKDVVIVRIKDMLSVKVVNKILFGSGASMIKPEGKKLLDKIIPTFKESEDKEILIEGHTDNVPISKDLAAVYPTNWELSTARATTVARYLESGGIRAGLLSAAGYSNYRPVASNDTEKGRAQNRRIEIVLRPKGGLLR